MYYGKEIRILLKGQAAEMYQELKKRNDQEAQTILNSFERMRTILKNNPQYGDPIPRRLFPKSIKNQQIQNLYRIELSNYWRMIYTIEGNNIEIFLFVLNIMNHKEYNKLFKYK